MPAPRLPFIAVNPNLQSSLKFKKLLVMLPNVTSCDLTGRLVTLWGAVFNECPDGDTSKWSDEDLEQIVGWQGEPGVFASALRAQKWIDGDGHVHDWREWGGFLYRMREDGTERVRKHRETHPKTPPVTLRNMEPNVTKPNLTNHRKTTSSPPVEDALFVEFYGAYPKKVQKQAALAAWAKLVNGDRELAVAGARVFGTIYRDAAPERKKFIPYPASWLNGRRWEDDPEALAESADVKKTSTPRISDEENERRAKAAISFQSPKPYDPKEDQP